MMSLIKKTFYYSIGVFILACVGGVCFLWWYSAHQADPLLRPSNPAFTGTDDYMKNYPNLQVDNFQFEGWDGTDIPAVIVQRSAQPSSQMERWRSLIDKQDYHSLKHADYVLVSVEWDHGIESALPIAEVLASAGMKCVLWESRGINDTREYCTHGLRESRDVPLLLNSLEKRDSRDDLIVIALGRGYGASLFLQSVSIEDRLSALISIDSYASLSESFKRSIPAEHEILTMGKMWLIDRQLDRKVGYEIFDVAPVESVIEMEFETPLLLMNLSQHSGLTTLNDALNIYRQSPSKVKEIWTLRDAADLQNETRTVSYAYKAADEEVRLQLDIKLKDNEDMAYVSMISWVDEMMARLMLEKQVATDIDKQSTATVQQYGR